MGDLTVGRVVPATGNVPMAQPRKLLSPMQELMASREFRGANPFETFLLSLPTEQPERPGVLWWHDGTLCKS
jgi:hypothetical protein